MLKKLEETRPRPLQPWPGGVPSLSATGPWILTLLTATLLTATLLTGGCVRQPAESPVLLGPRGTVARNLGLAEEPVGQEAAPSRPPLPDPWRPKVPAPSVTVRSVTAAPDPAPGTLPILGPPVRVDSAPPGVQTAETSIIASPDGELLATWGDTRLEPDGSVWRIGYAVSLDRGDTWHDGLLHSPATEEGPVQLEADPMTAWDPATGTFWAGGISFSNEPEAFLARKSAGDLTFEPPVRIRADGMIVDKGFLAAGPDPLAPATPDAPSTSSTLLHFIDRRGHHASADLGATWSDITFLGNLQGPLPRVGPNGELYVAFWNGLNGVQLLRSFDGGRTLEDRSFIARRNDSWESTDGSRFPGRFRAPALPYLAVDPVTGTLYCVYFDTVRREGNEWDIDLYFARSDDRGDTWTPARRMPFDSVAPEADPILWSDQFFPWLEVDALGRLHLVFYDTRNTVQRDDQENAHLDVYYAWSEDRGETWTERRLTDTSFTTGDIDWTIPEGQFVGDYLGLAVAGATVHPLYPVARDGDLDIWTRRLDFTLEGVPDEIPPTPRGLTASPASDRAVQLSWQPTGPGTSVVIEVRDLLSDEVILLGASPSAAGFLVENLGRSRPYAFRIATRSLTGVSGWSDEVLSMPMDTSPEVCEPPPPPDPEDPDAPPPPPPRTLCLLDDRFLVKVTWRDPASGDTGIGRALPLRLEDGQPSDSSGTFWFFLSDNIELVLKVLDATTVNDAFWVFYGSLTRVEYWVTVIDTATGDSRTYHNPPGSQCGLADTRAFPGAPPTGSSWVSSLASLAQDRTEHRISPIGTPGNSFPCEAGEDGLCLLNGRFRAEVSWRDPRTGNRGVGQPLPGTTDSGFFWFFTPDNVEMVVKVLDARRVNGTYWVFAGGLSDLEVDITVQETILGQQVRTYRKEAGDLCGIADTEAF